MKTIINRVFHGDYSIILKVYGIRDIFGSKKTVLTFFELSLSVFVFFVSLLVFYSKLLVDFTHTSFLIGFIFIEKASFNYVY